MKFTDFFIKHPVITLVLNFMIIAVGLLSLDGLSLREYPKIEFPVLAVSTHYSNANAELVEKNITNPLEEYLSGLEGLESMNSSSFSAKSVITLIFKNSISIDQVMLAAREAIALAKRDLPKEANEPILQKCTPLSGLPFIGIALSSPSRKFGELTHYANLFLKDTFKTISGVAGIEVWGRPYMMEIMLDPKSMYALSIDPTDVLTAIGKKQPSFPTGKFQNKVPTFLESQLSSLEDFQNIFLKDKKGKLSFLNAVSNVKLKTEDEGMRVRVNQKPGLLLGISKTTDANPLEVSVQVASKIESLKKHLPKDMTLELIIDQSQFIKASLANLQSAVIESIFLVLFVVFIFLRNMRATLIPLVTIPISLVGGIIFLKLFGCSINTFTLLSMVLAIGLVVDDAIVVLENVSRHIEAGLSPLEASLKGSREISFAVVAMTCTLASVYIPLAFMEGITGQLFIEFAVALSGSVILSGVAALTISPLMCSRLSQVPHARLFPQIDVFLQRTETLYIKALESCLAHGNKILGFMVILTVCMCVLFVSLPKEPMPKEDRAAVTVYIPSTPGNTLDDLEKQLVQIEPMLASYQEGKPLLAFLGAWGGSLYLPLSDRRKGGKTAEHVIQEMTDFTEKLPFDAYLGGGDPGLNFDGRGGGNANSLQVIISTSHSYSDLLDFADALKQKLIKKKLFQLARHDLNLDTLSYKISLNEPVAQRLGITHEQIAKSIEIFFGGNRSLEFQKDDILYPIMIKGNHYPWSLDSLYVVNHNNKKISIGTLAELTQVNRPSLIKHQNKLRSTAFTVQLKPNQSFEAGLKLLSGEIDAILPEGFKKEFPGNTGAQQEMLKTIGFLIVFALLFIYAILAIQFECFVSPLIVMTTVPFAGFGALLLLKLFGQSLNLFSFIGLITLIGLITKHGILIVEFANQLSLTLPLEDAVKKASILRLRPILMTTCAMVFGSMPLLLSGGAGSEARLLIGLTITGGVGIGTFFTIFILPQIYISLKRIFPSSGANVIKIS